MRGTKRSLKAGEEDEDVGGDTGGGSPLYSEVTSGEKIKTKASNEDRAFLAKTIREELRSLLTPLIKPMQKTEQGKNFLKNLIKDL